MRRLLSLIALVLLIAPLAACQGFTTSTAYMPTAVAPPQPAVQYQAIPVQLVPAAPRPAASPCAPAAPLPAASPCATPQTYQLTTPQAAPCTNGACASPGAAYAGGYMVTDTKYALTPQAAQAALIPADLIGCGANFLRCAWTTVLGPLLPPGPSSTYSSPMAVNPSCR